MVSLRAAEQEQIPFEGLEQVTRRFQLRMYYIRVRQCDMV